VCLKRLGLLSKPCQAGCQYRLAPLHWNACAYGCNLETGYLPAVQPRDRFLGIADQQHQWFKSLQRHGQNIWELMPQQLSAWARGPGTAIRESQSRLRRRWTPVSSNLQYDRLGGTGPGSLRCALLALQAEVFEETVSMDYLFEGIPTVPPRKDMDHMVTVWHSSSLLNAHSVQLSVCDTCLTVHTGLDGETGSA
jgi:hypothetical protein